MLRRISSLRSWPVALVIVAVAATGCAEQAIPIVFDNSLPPTTSAALDTTPPPTIAPTETGPASTGVASTPSAASTAVTASTALTASTAVTASTDPTFEGAWVDAAGNLAGLESECGNLSLVTARPTTSQVIASVALQGLWSTTDGGATWRQLGTDGEPILNRGNDIVFDPEEPTRFWESGSYNGAGVFRTDDDGESFVALGDVTHSEYLAVDFSDPDRSTILAGRHEGQELDMSLDGGATWQDISGGLPEGTGYSHAPVIVDTNTFLVGTEQGPLAGVYRSTDRGATWIQVHEGAVTGRLVVTQDGSQWLWLRDGGTGIIASSDRGLTWHDVGGPGPAFNVRELFVLPDGRLLTLGERVLVTSSDGGARWSPLGPPLPYDAAGLAYSATEGAVYAWRFDCPTDDPDPDFTVKADSIIRLELPPD